MSIISQMNHAHPLLASGSGTSPAAAASALAKALPPSLVIWIAVGGLIIAMIFTLIDAKAKGARIRAMGLMVALPNPIRAWMATALVLGLVVYTGATLGGEDEAVRNTLVGGLVAAVSSATAYYFATAQAQGANEAQAGTRGTSPTGVPDLMGKSLREALTEMGATNFKLVIDAGSVPGALSPQTIAEQTPLAKTSAPRNSEIVVKLAQHPTVPPASETAAAGVPRAPHH
jgi:PASTA domain